MCVVLILCSPPARVMNRVTKNRDERPFNAYRQFDVIIRRVIVRKKLSRITHTSYVRSYVAVVRGVITPTLRQITAMSQTHNT